MYVPKIKTTEGLKPITIVPDKYLLDAYFDSSACAEDKELVGYLLPLGNDEAARVLREVLEGGGELALVYPGLGQKEPKGARFVCPVSDGGLYLVKAPSNS